MPNLNIIDFNSEKERIVRIGSVQFKLDSSFYNEENKLFYPQKNGVENKYHEFLLKAKEHNINILCFPEISLNEEFIKELKKFADENGTIIIGGSFYNDERKNVCPIIMPSKDEIYFNEKINLAPVEKSSYPNEGAINGNDFYIIKNSIFGSFAVLICADFLDDTLKNRIYKENIDFLFVVSLNNRSEDFHIDMNRDCMKNKDGIYIVYSNSILKIGDKVFGDGQSAIFGLMDELYLDKDIHHSIKYKIQGILDEELIVADFDIKTKQPTFPRNRHTEPNVKIIYPYSTKKEKEILSFLNKIGLEESRYRKIDELYVSPTNFDEIYEKLKNEKIIFLIGDAEIGKTYTSVKLLLDSYREGYEPIYYKENQPDKQFEVIRDKLDRVVTDKTVIYFEDPWGKTEFKSPEHIFRDIGDLIYKVSTVDSRVIITSREPIFREFEEKKEIRGSLWSNVEKLKINVAYTKENLKEMLEKYLKVFEPRWYKEEKLKNLVLLSIDNGTLKTPMSIKQLIYSRYINDENSLKRAIEIVSEETNIVFGKEIIAMFEKGEYEKIVLLCFAFVSSGFNLNIVEKTYYKFLKFLNEEYNFDLIRAKNFNYVLNWFKGDKLEIYSLGRDYNILKFSHPSYSEGFAYALSNKQFLENIFSKFVLRLSKNKNKFVRQEVVELIYEHFNKFPELAEKVLINLSSDNHADIRDIVIWTVTVNFDNFSKPPEELLTKLSDDKYSNVRIRVLELVDKNFNKFPQFSEDMLLKLSEDKYAEVKCKVIEVIINNFDNFSKPPEELLINLSGDIDPDVRLRVLELAIENFDKFPNLSKRIFTNLSEDDDPYIKKTLVSYLYKNIDKFPVFARELLKKMNRLK